MTSAEGMTLNDILQWIAVAIILAIVIITSVRRTLRLRRRLKDGENPGCGCCDSCPSRCDLAGRCTHKKDAALKKDHPGK